MATKKLEARIDALEANFKKLEEQTSFIKDMIILQSKNIESINALAMGMVMQKTQSKHVPRLQEDIENEDNDSSSDDDASNIVTLPPQPKAKKFPQPIKLCGHLNMNRRVT